MGNSEIQGKLWGQMAHAWATIMEPNNSTLWEAMMDEVSVKRGTRLLDVGCGGGGASVLAAERGAIVSGFDAAEPLLEIARQRVPGGDFRQGDMEQLPFEDGAFDVVFAANSVQFPANRENAVSELRRVCTENGRIVAGLFGPPEKVNLNKPLREVVAALPKNPDAPNPFKLSMPGELEALLESAELNVVQTGSVLSSFSIVDIDTAYRGFLSSGPSQAASKLLSEDELKTVLYEGLRPFEQADGSILIEPNLFIYAVATR